MLQTLYPTIGTKVQYVRQGNAGEIERGAGIILGFGLDANKRITAHVELEGEQKNKVNVDLACLNPTEEYIEKFTLVAKEITALSEEGNGKVQELVAGYNKQVDDLYTDVLGKPVVFETEETETN